MAIFVLSNGDPEIIIPAGGTSINKVYGTIGVDKLNILQGANVILDPSFNAGIDLIHIQGNSNTFMISNSGATVAFTDSSGDIIKIPAGTVGQTLIFDDGSAKLQILNGMLMLGNQIITSTNTTINAIGNTSNATFNVSSNSSQVTEGNNATFTVNLSSAQSTTTTVNYTLSGTGGAVIGTDTGYVSPSGNSGTLTFAAGETTKTITVPITFDSVTETGEGLIVSLSNPSNGTTIGTASSAFTSITDSLIDTTPPVLVSSTPADNATGVAIANNITLGFSENVVIADASGIKLYDTTGNYVAANVSIVNGNNLVIDPTANLAGNTGYYVQVSATAIKDAAGNSFAGIANTTTFNFTTVSAAPTYSLTASSTNVNEGTNAIFNLVTTNVAAGTVLNYTLSGSGITASDIIGGSLTGSVTVGSDGKGTIAVPISSDLTTEGIEILSANLNNGLATAYITLNDTSITTNNATFNVSSNSSQVTEGNNATFTVNLSTPQSTATTVNYTLSGTGGAVIGTDTGYVSPSGNAGTLTFAAGETTKTITVPITFDSVTETGEGLMVYLYNPSNGTVLGSTSTASTSIIDAAAPTFVLTSDVVVGTPTQEGKNITFTVTPNGIVNQDTTLLVNITGSTVGAISAQASSADFTSAQTVTFKAGETAARTTYITVVDDNITEGIEGYKAQLLNSSYSEVAYTNGIISDPSYAYVLTGPTSVDEGASATFTVTTNLAAPTGGITIPYTITGNATAGADFTPGVMTGTITIAAGSKTGTVILNATADNTTEATAENIIVMLGTPSTGNVITGTVTTSINDTSQGMAGGTVSLSASTTSVNEGSSVTYTVSLGTAAPAGGLNIPYYLSGTSTLGSDYTGSAATTGNITVAAGATTGTLTLTTFADTNTEGAETLINTIVAPSGYTLATGKNTTTTTINDTSVTVNQSYTTFSIDSGTASTPANINASSGSFNFTDNASILNNVIISGFSSNDKITVSNNTYYDFTSNGSDVGIEYNNNGILNKIVLTGVVSNGALVYDEASFEAAIGFNAISYA